jgi:hypothetical protein
MTLEQLKEYLREHLKVDLRIRKDFGVGCLDHRLVVRLRLDDEVISSDEIDLPKVE